MTVCTLFQNRTVERLVKRSFELRITLVGDVAASFASLLSQVELMEVKTSMIKVMCIICTLLCLSVVEYLWNKKSIYTFKSRREPRPQWRSSQYRHNTSKLHLPQYRCSYVGLEDDMIDKTLHGIGNRLFQYAAMMYVAWLTGRRPCLFTTSTDISLHKVFDVHILRKNKSTCQTYKFQQQGVGVYDSRVKSLLNVSQHKYLLLGGYFQSWTYIEPIATQLRQQLRFKRTLTKFVADFLYTRIPAGWSTLKFVRIGVHVRRGDFLHKSLLAYGFSTASERYLQEAMSYFVERFPRVQFIVASNDIPWCNKHVKLSMFNKTTVNITFSVNHDAAQDLAILASCNHTVMSTGTYSWWAAWLANGTTVYYANYPKRGSALSKFFRSEEYYYRHWIGMNDTK